MADISNTHLSFRTWKKNNNLQNTAHFLQTRLPQQEAELAYLKMHKNSMLKLFIKDFSACTGHMIKEVNDCAWY